MSKKILKYLLHIQDAQHVTLPIDSTILSVKKVGKDSTERLCLYAIVDEEEEEAEDIFIEIIGTGNPIYEDMGVDRKFLGTVIMQNGSFVAHVFQRLN